MYWNMMHQTGSHPTHSKTYSSLIRELLLQVFSCFPLLAWPLQHISRIEVSSHQISSWSQDFCVSSSGIPLTEPFLKPFSLDHSEKVVEHRAIAFCAFSRNCERSAGSSFLSWSQVIELELSKFLFTVKMQFCTNFSFAPGDRLFTSVEIFVTLEKVFVALMKIFVTLVEICVVLVEIFVALVELFVTLVEICVVLVEIFVALLEIFVTSTEIFVTLVVVFVASIFHSFPWCWHFHNY